MINKHLQKLRDEYIKKFNIYDVVLNEAQTKILKIGPVKYRHIRIQMLITFVRHCGYPVGDTSSRSKSVVETCIKAVKNRDRMQTVMNKVNKEVVKKKQRKDIKDNRATGIEEKGYVILHY